MLPCHARLQSGCDRGSTPRYRMFIMLRNLKPELSLDTGMINSVSGILFSLGGIGGEHLQRSRPTDYYHSWLAGHLSDFYGGAALTSLALMAAGNNRYKEMRCLGDIMNAFLI